MRASRETRAEARVVWTCWFAGSALPTTPGGSLPASVPATLTTARARCSTAGEHLGESSRLLSPHPLLQLLGLPDEERGGPTGHREGLVAADEREAGSRGYVTLRWHRVIAWCTPRACSAPR